MLHIIKHKANIHSRQFDPSSEHHLYSQQTESLFFLEPLQVRVRIDIRSIFRFLDKVHGWGFFHFTDIEQNSKKDLKAT